MGVFTTKKSYNYLNSIYAPANSIGKAFEEFNNRYINEIPIYESCLGALKTIPRVYAGIMGANAQNYIASTNFNSSGNASISDYQSYNAINLTNNKYLVGLTLTPATALSNAANYYYPLTEDKTTWDAYADSTNIYTTDVLYNNTEFLTAFADYYIISSIKFYDNNNDGSYSSGTQRPLAYTMEATNPFDYFIRFSYETNKESSTLTTTTGDGDVLHPLFFPLFYNPYTGYNRTGYSVKLINDCGGKFIAVSTLNGKTNTLANFTHTPYKIWTLENLKKVLNTIGVPFAFTDTDAKNTNSNALPDFAPIGQTTDTTGGGEGTGDNSTDSIFNISPNVSPVGSFNRMFAMTQPLVNAFSTYLWTSTWLDNVKLLFNNPMEGVVKCMLFPFSVYAHDPSHVGADTPIKIGNVETTVSAAPITSGYNCVFNMGSAKIDEYYGTAMDYEPYTSISIYLPYIGIKDISTNEVTGKTISIKYIVDICNGSTIAQIWANSQLLYTYEGKIGIDIPINSTNAAQYASSLLMTGVSAAAGIAIGAATANPLAIAGTVLSTAKSVTANQFHINKGGISSPSAGFYMPQHVYLIINRPIQSLASSFGATHGFPCNVTRLLSTLTGYTEVENPILTSINATEDEKTQIKNLLETGVIFA